MKKIAISQSNYIPWKGYFDLINRVDEFVLYDDAQYTRRDWRNRNKLKTSQGLKWLTIPVDVKGKYFQKINEIKISDKGWTVKHWRQIKQNYAKAKNFKKYKDIFEELYLNCKEEYLSEINHKFIITINQILGIKTRIRFSSEFDIYRGGDRTEKLINICKQCNATIYISGPAAKSYFDEQLANKENIQVKWMNYENYKEYEQMHPPFEHGVTILDLIFNTDAQKFIKSFINEHS
jgi:hypothetical protein